MQKGEFCGIMDDMDLSELSLPAKEIFSNNFFTITNTLALIFVLSAVLVFIFYLAFRKREEVPNFLQNFFEWMLESIGGFMDSIIQDEKRTKEIFPLAITIFFLILISNLFELLPGLGVFSISRSPSSDLNFGLALSFVAMTTIHFLALRNLGWLRYSQKFLNFKSAPNFIIGVFEFVGEFTKTISLAFRLFGNLFAGEVILTLAYSSIPLLVPVPILFFEIFVGLLQAFIFSTLLVIFYVLACDVLEL